MSTMAIEIPLSDDQFEKIIQDYEINQLERYSKILARTLRSLYEKEAENSLGTLAKVYGVSVEDLKARIEQSGISASKRLESAGKVSSGTRPAKNKDIFGYKTYSGKFKVIPWTNIETRQVSQGANVEWIQKIEKEPESLRDVIRTDKLLEANKITLQELIAISPDAVKIKKEDQWVNATDEDFINP